MSEDSLDEQVKIRATSTLKLVTIGGSSLTYQYHKQCSVDEIMRDTLFAVFRNKGADGCREFIEDCIEKFEAI